MVRVVQNIEYTVCEKCKSFRCWRRWALNFNFVVSGLFRPAVGKTFILTLAVGISFGFSFAYILMATTHSLEEFPFFLSRYVIWWTLVTCQEIAIVQENSSIIALVGTLITSINRTKARLCATRMWWCGNL
jgi:hypothetical protein